VNRFITLAPHPGTNNVSIADYVKRFGSKDQSSGTSPVDVSEQIHDHADNALRVLDKLDHGGVKDLRLTLGDIRAMAYLGKYYAHKIRGATEAALFRVRRQPEHRNAAAAELNLAAKYWRLYASTALAQYRNPLWTNRVGYCDWRHLFNHVLDDVTVDGGELQLQSMAPTPGGTILEAESAKSKGLAVESRSQGHTGDGYLAPMRDVNTASVQWTFDAPDAGDYVLELRYAVDGRDQLLCRFAISAAEPRNMICWTTGGASVWAWDRITVGLRKGPNTITFLPRGLLLIDHLNVLPTGAPGE
jgi:hypothetical protein